MTLILSFMMVMILNKSMKHMDWAIYPSLMALMLQNYFSSLSFKKFFSLEPMLIMLSLWLTLVVVVLIKAKQDTFLNSLSLLLMLIVIIFFNLNNLMLVFIFFELSIMPIFLMIMIWGYQTERLLASLSLMFYTFSASLPLLLGIVILNSYFNTTFAMNFMSVTPWCNSTWLTFFLLMAFLVKTPMYLTHMWLPKAHVEAPVFGSMVLAAILLKMGTYGLLMVMLSLNKPSVLMYFTSLSIWGMLVTALYCMKIMDMKVMIAISSVSHMAMLLILLKLDLKLSILSAVLMMITHAFTSSALFFNINEIYEKSNSRNIIFNKGSFAPLTVCLMWSVVIMSNISAPPSINFIAEILAIIVMMTEMGFVLIMVIIFIVLTSTYSYTLFSITAQQTSENLLTGSNQKKLYLINLSHLLPIFFCAYILPLF